jgi:hypothetical protein
MIMVVVVGFAGFLGVWRLTGGSDYVVSTPSMCPKLCVGSLVLDRPLHGVVQVGQLISFRPNGSTGAVYTHRVFSVQPDGTFLTKGDAEAFPDPWVIARGQIVGVPVATVWGLGYLELALPWMLIALAIFFITRRRTYSSKREVWDRIFETALLLVPLVVLKPLIRGSVIESVQSTRPGWITETVVNTGLLPSQIQAVGGQFRDHIASGHLVRLSGPAVNDQLSLHQLPSFYWWGWLLVALVIAYPLVVIFIEVAVDSRRDHRDARAAEQLGQDHPETAPLEVGTPT